MLNDAMQRRERDKEIVFRQETPLLPAWLVVLAWPCPV